jgi:hypothetical protein
MKVPVNVYAGIFNSTVGIRNSLQTINIQQPSENENPLETEEARLTIDN